MIELNLIANNKQEEIVKNYLQENVSEILADKINNGVQIVKEDKTLINKKTLSGFMKFACEEARKQAEKGLNSACVEDVTVFGWAIHYFEEDSIEEKLFNEDGTEYKVETKKKEQPKIEVKPKQKENKQSTLFDLLDMNNYQKEPKIEECEEFEEDTEESIKEEIKPILEEKEPTNKVDIQQNIGIDNQTFDKYQLKTISMLLDGKVVLK